MTYISSLTAVAMQYFENICFLRSPSHVSCWLGLFVCFVCFVNLTQDSHLGRGKQLRLVYRQVYGFFFSLINDLCARTLPSVCGTTHGQVVLGRIKEAD